MEWAEQPVLVRVPATSANLGPGFDSLGLALGLHDEVEARVTGSGLDIEVDGEGAADIAGAGERHLIVRAMRVAFDELDVPQPPGLELRCRNRIPHGRGLGSSAAAIVAGLLAARALAGRAPVPRTCSRWPACSRAPGQRCALPVRRPDHRLAGTAGGRAGRAGDPARPVPEVRLVAFIAPEPVSTRVARGLLPPTVPHADAARNAGRAALLVAALTARPAALLDGTEDKLHQDYRAPAMPHSRLLTWLRAAGYLRWCPAPGRRTAFRTGNPARMT